MSPMTSCFTNMSDSKKNKACQFCRMCSFLFTASGGKKHSDALKHDGKGYPSKTALAEEKPLLPFGWTVRPHSADIPSHTPIQKRSVTHTPNMASLFGEEGRRGNKQPRSQVNVNSSLHQEAITSL